MGEALLPEYHKAIDSGEKGKIRISHSWAMARSTMCRHKNSALFAVETMEVFVPPHPTHRLRLGHRVASVGHSRTSPTAPHRMCAPSSDSCEQSKNKPSCGIQPKAKAPERILSRPTCSTVLANAILRHRNIHSRKQHWCRTKRLYQPLNSTTTDA